MNVANRAAETPFVASDRILHTPASPEPSSDLDPQVIQLLASAVEHGAPAADPLADPLADARAAAERHYSFLSGSAPKLADVQHREIAGPVGPLSLRFYRPRTDLPLPVLLWFHGGGFVLNSLDTHDRLFRLLAHRGGFAVCAASYSKAPEHRFPVQVDEASGTLRWLAAHGHELGLDTGSIAVGGDSAGANLALVTALGARRAGPRIAFGALLYGMFAKDFDTASHGRFGGGRHGLSTARMRWYWSQYLGDAAPDERAAPLAANLSDLPPLLLVGAGADCLLDDTRRLAERLTQAGVPHRLWVCPSMPHSFAQMTRTVAAADAAVTRIAEAIAEALTSKGGNAP